MKTPHTNLSSAMTHIDLVFLWVNGNDPKWKARHDAYTGNASEMEGNCTGRYADSGELKYSLRSVERYAPWIRNIFIVTDRQVPEWLNTAHPRIHIVDHSDIMPPECLPCFNSVVIEHHLHLIPGLSEHFLYANDDIFFNRPVKPSSFFAADGLPIIRLNRRCLKRPLIALKAMMGCPVSLYNQTIHNAALLVEKKFGTYYNGKPHHNIDAYMKSGYELARNIFDAEIGATLQNHLRASNDIQRCLYAYVAIATRCGHLRYVNQHFSFRFHIDNHKQYEKFKRYAPTLFCMNDSQYATEEDREMARHFLEDHFGVKSQFEK